MGLETIARPAGHRLTVVFLSGVAGWLLAVALYRADLAALCGAGSPCEVTVLPGGLLLSFFVLEWVAGGACAVLTTRGDLGRAGPAAGLLGVCTFALGALVGPVAPGLWIATFTVGACFAYLIGFAGIWAALHATGAFPGSHEYGHPPDQADRRERRVCSTPTPATAAVDATARVYLRRRSRRAHTGRI